MNKIICLIVLLLSYSLSYAGKPYRPSVDELIKDSFIIVRGEVESIHPSLMVGHGDTPLAVAKVKVMEQLKGQTPKIIYITTNYKPQLMFDGKGKVHRKTTAYIYWVGEEDNDVLFFLEEKDLESHVYRPVKRLSGVVKLKENPKFLQEIKEQLKAVR